MRVARLLVATLTVSLVWGQMRLQAQESADVVVDSGASAERLQDLESRLAMLESKQLHDKLIPSTHVFSTARCSAYYAGFELALLCANVGALSIDVTALPGLAGQLTAPFDINVSPRIYAGYEASSGLGFRTSYWQFDHHSDTSPLNITSGLEMHALDLEGTMHTVFHRTDFFVSGGMRYGYQKLSAGASGIGFIGFESEGLGPTLATQLRRNLGTSKLSVYAGGRASILLSDNQVSIPGLVNLTADDSSMQILELQGGLQYNRRLQNVDLLTQVGGEVQNWQAGAIAGIVAPTVALYGPTFRIGFSY